MQPIPLRLRKIGNSQGFVIPRPTLAQLGMDDATGAEMTIEDNALVLRRPSERARKGWAEASKRVAEVGDDALLMGEFGNSDDADLIW